MFRLNKKAQSTLEYAVLIFVIVAALIVMQVYMKRGVQGRMKESTDQIGEQYSPGRTGSDYTSTRISQTLTQRGEGGAASGETYTDYQQDSTTRTGSETVAPEAQERWPGPATP